MLDRLTITIAGAAGQGLVTVSKSLLTSLARLGYRVFASQDYMSRVRGGHNFMRIHIAKRQPRSAPDYTNLLLALDSKSVEIHSPAMRNPSAVILDPATVAARPGNGAVVIDAPLSAIAKEIGSPVYMNSTALGALFAVLGLELESLNNVFAGQFSKKAPKILEDNIAAAKAGYDYVNEKGSFGAIPLWKEKAKGRFLIDGSHAIGLGLISAGLRFISSYPMSPSTGIFTYITSRAVELGIVSEQAEDEISALNMVIGASSCGARAATTTSGGGLALMSEAVSLAGISEAPVTIANIMRPGPATGLPTRTGQEDLDFVMAIGHGEFPRFIFAPRSQEDALYTAAAAMNLAEKYQVPSFILGDQHLVDSFSTVDKMDMDKTRMVNQLADPSKVELPYLRYRFTKTGVSPRLRHGVAEASFITDSHVHEENGHITEDPLIARKMAEKRFAKLAGMEKEKFGLPLWHGEKNAKVVFACFGSASGAVMDAVDVINKSGGSAAAICFNRVTPFPAVDAKKLLAGKRNVHVVENNYQGQFQKLLSANTGVKCAEPVRRYDGRPFDADYIIESLRKKYRWRT